MHPQELNSIIVLALFAAVSFVSVIFSHYSDSETVTKNEPIIEEAAEEVEEEEDVNEENDKEDNNDIPEEDVDTLDTTLEDEEDRVVGKKINRLFAKAFDKLLEVRNAREERVKRLKVE